MSTHSSRRAIFAAFAANLGIAAAKLVGFALTGASSMLSEAVHSLADTGNQGLLLLGGRRAARPADERHPFGYGRERFFWAFVVSIVLFGLGAVFSLYEGVHKLVHPEPLESPMVAVGILFAAVVMEGLSFRTAVRESRSTRGGRSLAAYVRAARSPELPVVIVEDFGALVGLAVALTAVGLSTVTGNPVFDGVGAVTIGLILAVLAGVLCVEMKRLLIGEAASDEDVAAIHAAIDGDPAVTALIHLRTQQVGGEEVLVAAKLAYPLDMTVAELGPAIDETERRIREVVPHVTALFIEPDVLRPAAG